MNRIYFADNLFHKTPRDIFNEPGLVVYIDPKLVNRQYFEAHISIFNTAEVTYRPNWSNDGEHMSGGCILNATVGTHGHVSLHSHVKATDINEFNDSEMIWGSRQAAIGLLKEAILQFIQYFPQPGNPV